MEGRVSLPLKVLGNEPYCVHWLMKGSCRFGDTCSRVHTHTVRPPPPASGPFYKLYKAPRFRSPCCILRRTLELNGWHWNHDHTAADLVWANCFIMPSPSIAGVPFLKQLKHRVLINHFPKSYLIAHKDHLYRVARGEPFLPTSYVLNVPADAELFMKLGESAITVSQDYAALKERGEQSIFIFKPFGLGEGRGVIVTDTVDAAFLSQRGEESYVAQRYIANPLLVNGRKTDLRIYVAVFSWNPLRIFLFQDGIVRFAAEPYTVDTAALGRLTIHLCNNAVSRTVNEKINHTNWTLPQFREYVTGTLRKEWGVIWDQIKQIAIRTCGRITTEVAGRLKSLREEGMFSGRCFELFGFDILVDDTLKCWLCEVNSAPDLDGTSDHHRVVYAADWDVKTLLVAQTIGLALWFRDNEGSAPAALAGQFEEIT